MNPGLVPAPDGGDDFVWIGGPGEGLRLLIVLFAKRLIPVAGRRRTDRRRRLSQRLVSGGKKPSTALNQEADVGVKWNVDRE